MRFSQWFHFFQQRRTSLFLGLMTCLGLSACVGSDTGDDSPQPDGLDRKAALTAITDNVILPAQQAFVTSAQSLAEAIVALNQDVLSQEVAQQAWRQAMTDWQRLEMLQLGPAGLQSDVVGGESLRDEVYSWPFTNPCGVDQQIVSQDYETSDFTARKLVYYYGLDALEYLLFAQGDQNACPGPDTINSSGSWAALSLEEIASRRRAYAVVVAKALVDQANALRQAWVPGSGNFRGVLLGDTGRGTDGFASDEEALDQVFDAFFYVDLVVTDLKLAAPAGLSNACPQATCSDLVESRFSQHSRENVVANLQAAQDIYLGGGEGGFDALLQQAGEDVLDETVQSKIAASLESAKSSSETLTAQLTDAPDEVRSLHSSVQALSDALKADFAAVLRLSVPGPGGGDAD